MSHPFFHRFQSPGTMMQAEQELLALGEDAVPILATLFSGDARNEHGVPYRRLGLPLRCALEVAMRLRAVAKPLEPFLVMELKTGDYVAAQALGALGSLHPRSVEALAHSLDGGLDLSMESACALIACGEGASEPVRVTLSRSQKAATAFSLATAFLAKAHRKA